MTAVKPNDLEMEVISEHADAGPNALMAGELEEEKGKIVSEKTGVRGVLHRLPLAVLFLEVLSKMGSPSTFEPSKT